MKKLFIFLLVNFSLTLSLKATPITGIFSIPGDYSSISAAITDINTNGVGNGGVIFNINAGYTESVTGLSITTLSTVDSNHFIIFRKSVSGVNPKITASGTIGTADAAIAILGSSYVTFDGIDVASSGTNVEYGYYLQNVSGTAGAQHNTIKNCQITLSNSNTNSIGIYQNTSISVTSALGANSFNTYYKVNIDNSYTGIWLLAQSFSIPDSNCVVDSCKIGATANSIGGNGSGATWGIRCDVQSGVRVSGSEVSYITMSGTKNIGGVFLSNCPGSTLVYNNKIHDIKVSGTSASSTPTGIRIDEPSGCTSTVFNNMIWGFSHGMTNPTATIICRGISINQNAYTGTVNVYFNTVSLVTGAAPSNAVFSILGGTANIKNNIFYNTSTAGITSSRYCIYATSGTINSSDYNELYISSGTNNYCGNYANSNKSAISDWRTATSTDANSMNIALNFISSSNLHLNVNTNCTFDNKGTPIAGLSYDIDNNSRDASNPDIGADEFTFVCIPSNYYTVTGGGSYCSGTPGLPIGLSGSQSGVKYQLWRDGNAPAGLPVLGTGSAISFGNQPTSGIYTVKTTTDGCYCTETMTGNAEIIVNPIPPSPTGDTLQVFYSGGAVSDLHVNGTNIFWYNSMNGVSPVSLSDSLINGAYYFAGQVINGCESVERLSVHADVEPIRTIILHLTLEGLFDKSNNVMLEAIDGNTNLPKWGAGIADRIHVDLYEGNPPYTYTGVSVSGIDLDTSGVATFQLSPLYHGNYFIKITNRNHLGVWSAVPVSFNSHPVEYSFNTGMLQAYGSNSLVQVMPNKFALGLGDLDQNGYVDLDDFSLFEPQLTIGTTGFIISDFNGSGYTDLDDFSLFEPRLTIGNTTEFPGK